MSNIEMNNIEMKQFQNPDEVRVFEKGRFEVVRIGGTVIGRATYEPGGGGQRT